MKRVVGNLNVHWWGVSAGGEHYFGEIHFSEPEKPNLEIKHAMTAKEAKYLNKKDGIPAYARYKPGVETERFETKEQLVAHAITEFKKIYPDGVLICGSQCSASPHPIVFAPDKFRARVEIMNKWASEHDSLYNNYGYIKDEARGDKLEDDWTSLLESILEDN